LTFPSPALPEVPAQNWFVTALPVVGIGVMALFYVLRVDSILTAIPLLFLALLTIGGTMVAYRWRRKDYERRRAEAVSGYARLLEKKRARLQAAHDAQIAILEAGFPGPATYLDLVLARQPQLWERRPGDPDFVTFRLGRGHSPSRIRVTTPNPDLDNPELERAFELADAYRYLHDAPVTLSLERSYAVGLYGAREHALKTARAAICHLAVTRPARFAHPPDRLPGGG
jgi:S-DNA-T family DNA segregation ATPase FtsK/SpoIIIE